jgi:hypothetical protein
MEPGLQRVAVRLAGTLAVFVSLNLPLAACAGRGAPRIELISDDSLTVSVKPQVFPADERFDAQLPDSLLWILVSVRWVGDDPPAISSPALSLRIDGRVWQSRIGKRWWPLAEYKWKGAADSQLKFLAFGFHENEYGILFEPERQDSIWIGGIQ